MLASRRLDPLGVEAQISIASILTQGDVCRNLSVGVREVPDDRTRAALSNKSSSACSSLPCTRHIASVRTVRRRPVTHHRFAYRLGSFLNVSRQVALQKK